MVTIVKLQGEPTALQWACVHNWSLYNARGRGLLICNLKRASAKLRRYLINQRYTHAPLEVLMTLPISSKLRDQLGMVVYPGESGATVTRGCGGLNWLGGERFGEGRFATSREIAGFMGISSRLGPYCAALRHYSDYQVCGLLARLCIPRSPTCRNSCVTFPHSFAAHFGFSIFRSV